MQGPCRQGLLDHCATDHQRLLSCTEASRRPSRSFPFLFPAPTTTAARYCQTPSNSLPGSTTMVGANSTMTSSGAPTAASPHHRTNPPLHQPRRPATATNHPTTPPTRVMLRTGLGITHKMLNDNEVGGVTVVVCGLWSVVCSMWYVVRCAV